VVIDQRPVTEESLGKPYALTVRVREFVDRYRLPEEVSGVEKHRTERKFLPAPQRPLRIETDVAVLIVG